MIQKPAHLFPARVKAGLLTSFLLMSAAAAFAQDDANGLFGFSGAVYTMTNAAAGNAILAYQRSANGALTPAGTFSTGGLGTGAGLGTQGALALTADARWLLAVNAGSNDITVFAVNRGVLVWKSKTPSGGAMPISLAIHDNRVFVVNTGSGNISGFHLLGNGALLPIANSQIPLTGSAPAQISFNNPGDKLVVTEKSSNSIAVFLLDGDKISGPIEQPSHGATPFGFSFDRRDHLLVTEATGGPGGNSAVSSYDLEDDGQLQVISGSADTTQASACWLAVTGNGFFAYSANTAAGTLSSFFVSPGGKLSLLHGVAANNGSGSKPGDLALSNNSRYLYSLNPGSAAILIFRVNPNGSLTPAGSVTGVPASAAGLEAR